MTSNLGKVPSQPDAWLEVARERAADAEAMIPKRQGSCGPVYMVGYAIECALKAYLQARGIQFPSSGGRGHDLQRLWARTGFKLRDLNDQNGAKAFFLRDWNTSLRYTVELPSDFTLAELIQSAKALSGWLHHRVRRSHPRSRR